jgi:hypothetical protein
MVRHQLTFSPPTTTNGEDYDANLDGVAVHARLALAIVPDGWSAETVRRRALHDTDPTVGRRATSVGEERGGSIDRRLPAPRSRVRSARTSRLSMHDPPDRSSLTERRRL